MIKAILFIISISIASELYSQYGEFSFHYRYGTPTSNFKETKIDIDPKNYKNCKTLNDQGLVFTYSYPIWKKFKLKAFVGFEYAETQRYLPIIDPNYNLQLSNIRMNNNRVSYRFGIIKAFHLYQDKVQIELGLTFAKRNYVRNNILLEEEYQRAENRPFIEYRYQLTTKYDESFPSPAPVYVQRLINKEISLAIKFKVIENLFINVNFAFSRNYFVLYDMNSQYRYYLNGSQTPTSSWQSYGLLLEDKMFSKNDHFLYTGIGLSYDFNFKKKEPSKI